MSDVEGELRRAFGRSVRAERIRLGISQEAWADVLQVHRTRAGAIERGEKNLTLRSVEELSARLGIDPLVMLSGPEARVGEAPVLRAAHDGGDVEGDLRDQAKRSSSSRRGGAKSPSGASGGVKKSAAAKPSGSGAAKAAAPSAAGKKTVGKTASAKAAAGKTAAGRTAAGKAAKSPAKPASTRRPR